MGKALRGDQTTSLGTSIVHPGPKPGPSGLLTTVVSEALPGCQGNSRGHGYFCLSIIHVPVPSHMSAVIAVFSCCLAQTPPSLEDLCGSRLETLSLRGGGGDVFRWGGWRAVGAFLGLPDGSGWEGVWGPSMGRSTLVLF